MAGVNWLALAEFGEPWLALAKKTGCSTRETSTATPALGRPPALRLSGQHPDIKKAQPEDQVVRASDWGLAQIGV